MAPVVRLRFDLIWRAPKGMQLKPFIIGTITELGAVDLTIRNFWPKFESRVLDTYADFAAHIEKKRRAKMRLYHRAQMDRGSSASSLRSVSRSGSVDEDFAAVDSASDIRSSSESSGGSVASEILEQIGRGDPFSTLGVFIERSFEVLTFDPDEEGIENLWQSELIPISSCSYPDAFSFAFAAWSITENKLLVWEILSNAREIKMPNIRECRSGNKGNIWVYRAKWGTRADEKIVPLRGEPFTRPPSAPSGDDFDDDFEDEY